MTRSLAYRPEIDGLRAIAIGLTCLYHFEIGGAENGFLGISVFFVLSGYLVGGIVFRSLHNGEFRLLTFWRRRLTRLLPALLAVTTTVLFAGYFILLPEDYFRTASTIRASLLIHANHQLYALQDYFGPDKYEVHFLHSWSLSVEEQFYLIFPALAWAVARSPKWQAALLCGAVLCGFALHVWGRYSYPLATHYFLPTRAWELMLGASVFLLARDHPRLMPRGTLCAWGGLAMTVGPAFLSQTASVAVNVAAHLSVVAGSAIIIAGTEIKNRNPIAWFLSTPAMRGLGLISYSLYLIHWPLLTLAMYFWIEPISAFGRALLLGASVLLAAACWRWIETPVRRLGNAEEISDRQVFLISTISVAMVVLATHLIIQFQGVPSRLNEQSKAAARGATDFSPVRTRCHSDEVTKPVPPEESCLLGNSELSSIVAVWGDSHGVELAYELATLDRVRVRQLTSSSCPPLLDLTWPDQSRCTARNAHVLQYLSKHSNIRTVVLVQHFSGYANIDQNVKMAALERTVMALRKIERTVVILGPLPFPRINVPSSMARSAMYGWTGKTIALQTTAYRQTASPIIDGLHRIGNRHDAQVIILGSVLCNKTLCPFAKGGSSIYFDDHHLSLKGANLVAMHILPLINSRPSVRRIQ